MIKLLLVSILISFSLISFSQSNSVFENNLVDHSKRDFSKNEIGLGFENYAKATGLNGGNYLFLQYHYMLYPQLALGAKASSDLSPSTFEDIISQVGLRYNTLPGEYDLNSSFGIYFMKNFNSSSQEEWLNFDLSLICFTDEDFKLDILPIGILYSLDEGKFSINYKFLGLSFLF